MKRQILKAARLPGGDWLHAEYLEDLLGKSGDDLCRHLESRGCELRWMTVTWLSRATRSYRAYYEHRSCFDTTDRIQTAPGDFEKLDSIVIEAVDVWAAKVRFNDRFPTRRLVRLEPI